MAWCISWIVGGLGLALDPEGQRGIVDHGAGAERDGDGLDAGDGAHIVVELAQAGARLGGSGGGVDGKRQNEGDGVAGIEAGIDAPERREAAQHQPGADEEHQGQARLRRRRKFPAGGGGAAGAAAAFLEHLLQIDARNLERGGEAKDNPANSESASVKSSTRESSETSSGARQSARQGAEHRPGAANGEQESQRAAEAAPAERFR